MWHTPLDDRVLVGGDWALFREALRSLWDEIEGSPPDDPVVTGVRAFDQLRAHQRLAMLALVGSALRDEGVPTPELTACTEGTVAAVYRHVADAVLWETDRARTAPVPPCPDEDPTFWRQLVVAACRENLGPAEQTSAPEYDEESSDDWVGPLPAESSNDHELWTGVIDWLANRVLWEDEDYEMLDEFLDAPPEEAGAMRLRLRIDDGYFTAVAPDPTGDELRSIRSTLRGLCGRT